VRTAIIGCRKKHGTFPQTLENGGGPGARKTFGSEKGFERRSELFFTELGNGKDPRKGEVDPCPSMTRGKAGIWEKSLRSGRGKPGYWRTR